MNIISKFLSCITINQIRHHSIHYMKLRQIVLFTILLIGYSYNSFSQTSTAGYVLFGKNKSEQIAACSDQGICKLQQMADNEFIPVTFYAMPLSQGSNQYKITMSFSIDSLREKQPHEMKFFENATLPFMVSDKFVFPKWVIAGLGFNTTRNKFVTIQAPFSMGIPTEPDAEGKITLTFGDRITINQ